VQSLRDGNPTYRYPEYYDLSIALISMITLLILRELTLKFGVKFASRILKPVYQGAEREERAERMVMHFYKSVYFTLAVIAGWYVNKDVPWLPKALLGKGDTSILYKGWPYVDLDSAPYLSLYQMIQLGFHAHILVTHFTEPPKKNFIEMLLHHTMTILLVVLGYFFNMQSGGSITLLVHDVSDIFVSAARGLMDTNYKKCILFLYICLMVSWGYTRLYVYPVHLIFPTMFSPDFEKAGGVPGYYVMASMANFLLFMHFYWFFMLGKIGYSFIVHKKTNDLVEGIDSKDKDQ
jgi:hypothetical protein